MNKYLIEVSEYFGGKKTFIIEASDKEDALNKAKIHVDRSHEFDNSIKDTIKVKKKLQK